MLGTARHHHESWRLLEHALETFAFGLKLTLDPHLVRDLDDDSHDTRRAAVFSKQRGIVEVEPNLLRFAAIPIKRKRKISIGERPAGEPHFHDIVVEVGDFRPAFPHLGAEQIRTATARERGIGVVVNDDPVLALQGGDWDRRAEGQCNCALEAGGPALYRAKGRRGPVKKRDNVGNFSAPVKSG
jgi:hypothetical protein